MSLKRLSGHLIALFGVKRATDLSLSFSFVPAGYLCSLQLFTAPTCVVKKESAFDATQALKTFTYVQIALIKLSLFFFLEGQFWSCSEYFMLDVRV